MVLPQLISREGVHSRCARWEAGRCSGRVPKGVFDEAAHVTGDVLAFVEELHGVVGGTAPELLANERIGNAIVVIIEADVIVDVGTDFLPLGVLIVLCRMRL